MKIISFSAVEILPSLLNKTKQQTIRPAVYNPKKLLEKLLIKEKIKGWKVKETKGKEGLTLFKSKTIIIGKEAKFGILLHEIAHVLSGQHHHHYTEEFNKELKYLNKKYNPLEKLPRFKVGEQVSLMWNQRSKYRFFCRTDGKSTCKHQGKYKYSTHGIFHKHLGIGKITEVFEIEMGKKFKEQVFFVGGDNYKKSNFMDKAFYADNLAKRDGFSSAEQMFSWFDKAYDLSKSKDFYVYRWKWDI